jgi:uncharacterized lipoprotein NlpE involved in copper resistance
LLKLVGKILPMRLRFLVALIMFATISCSDGVEVTTDISASASKVTPRVQLNELARFYSDTLPCASCAGIVTNIAILNDSLYFITELYLSENPVPFGRMGRYKREGDHLFLFGGEDSADRFEILSGQLKKLDKKGEEIVNGLDYTLEEVPMPKNLLDQVFLADGELSIENKQVKFKPCRQDEPWQVIQDKGAKEAEKYLQKDKSEDLGTVVVRATVQLKSLNDGAGVNDYQIQLMKINSRLGTSCN